MNHSSPGRGLLRFEKIGGKTAATEAFSRSPLKFLTPKNHGKASWVYSSNFGGGFVGGDAIDIDIEVGAGAHAVFLSQASTKVYGSVDECRQTIKADVSREGILFALPDPVVCFAGAKFHQHQSFHLEENSSLVLLDTLHCGREHSGERWDFHSYKNQIHVYREGKRIFHESLLLHPEIGELKKRHSRYNAFSLLLMTGPAVSIHLGEIQEAMNSRPPQRKEDFIFALSPLEKDGVVIRMAGVSTEAMFQATKEILYFLPEHLGDDPWLRKW